MVAEPGIGPDLTAYETIVQSHYTYSAGHSKPLLCQKNWLGIVVAPIFSVYGKLTFSQKEIIVLY